MIFLTCITIIAILIAVYCALTKKKIDTATKEANKKIYEEKNKLEQEYEDIKNKHSDLAKEITQFNITIDNNKKILNTLQDNLKSQQDLSNNAFSNYFEILERKYEDVEKDYKKHLKILNDSYGNIQLRLLAETDEIRKDLDKIRATRAAAIEAERRERDIENNFAFYCLGISESDKMDISKLEALKPSLNNSRVLSMLIWQTFCQKPLKTLCANIIGTEEKTGIYKITNIKTKECYIGQAVNIKDRWVTHVKCGLGIDTPANNKLYRAMQDFGVWNFSFEVLEECPRSQLNEKERYYIDLYSSYEMGYNSNKGIKINGGL